MFLQTTNPNPRIFVIEDDPEYLHEIRSYLKKFHPDAHIDHANGYADVKEKIPQGQYDQILLDYSLRSNWGAKEFDGLGVNIIPFIRQHSKQSKVIGISNEEEGNRRLLEHNADAAVHKSIFLFQ